MGKDFLDEDFLDEDSIDIESEIRDIESEIKERNHKILFTLSWTPHVVILINSICSIFTGTQFMFGTVYGLDAFITTALFSPFYAWPIFIVILVYHTYCLIKWDNKKNS